MSKSREVEILLVEDNANDLELTLKAFQKHHLTNKVVIARDGVEALDYIFGTGTHAGRNSNAHPKVVFLDLKLPKVDGLEVLKKIKADESTRTIPVVVLTSSAEEKDIIESYKLGVNSYIVKPVDFDKFLNTVSELGLYWVLLNQDSQ